jgi:hypothetical protein
VVEGRNLLSELSFSPRALLASHAWTSVFFTTYSLSLSFLEAIPLAAVSRSYRDFTVVTDIAGYRSSLADVGAVGIPFTARPGYSTRKSVCSPIRMARSEQP